MGCAVSTVAAVAADPPARRHSNLQRLASGRIAACYTVPGPGLTNALTGLGMAYAESVPLLLIAAQNKKPVYEYSPAEVKHHVADYGASSKEQMQEMVKILLDLDEVPQPHDAADALAVAICHLRESRLRELINESQ